MRETLALAGRLAMRVGEFVLLWAIAVGLFAVQNWRHSLILAGVSFLLGVWAG